VSPHAPPGDLLREWIAGRLDPLDAAASNPAPLKPAAVLIGLVEHPQGLSVILTRRADTLRSHTGQVAFPGGACDPGEAAPTAALRETHEEIGLDPDRVSLAGLSTPYCTGTGYHVIPVVGFVTPGFSLAPNPTEVADVFEAPFGFLMDPANFERREGRSPAGDVRRYYAATWRDQLIWGATAGMIRALHDRLYGEHA
jgi:8-oxo-dGTP pyrophosphatase MutT (NUDIX family)